MVFKKKRMIARLIIEGLDDLITPDIEDIMDDLDGCEASPSCWARQVRDEPVLWCVGKSGVGREVNEADCI